MDPLGALGDVLGRGMGGLPVWGWVAIVGGVFVLVWLGRKKFGNQGSTSSDGGSLGSGTANSALDPNIDPNTGVPYSIESAINPNTGLPAYYGGAGVTNQGAPPGGWDLAQLIAALQQIQNQTNQQQNPSGPGGIPGTLQGTGLLPTGDVGGWVWDVRQDKWVFNHGNAFPPPGGWGPPPYPPPNGGQPPAPQGTGIIAINSQSHAPVLATSSANMSSGMTYTAPMPQRMNVTPPVPPPSSVRTPSTTTFSNAAPETGQRTVQPTALRPGIRAQ